MSAGIRIETATEDWFLTPGGNRITMGIRPGSSDWNTCNACNGTNDEYRIPQGITGWALDVGAHIGAATVPLLVDNPGLRCIAIEALPENVVMLMANLERNGVSDRASVLMLAASDSHRWVTIGYGPSEGELSHSEYIGGSGNAYPGARSVSVRGVSLRGALLYRGPDQDEPVVWTKIDCEGCEYPFLASPDIGLLERIVGEVHFGAQRLRDILEPTHDVKVERDFGLFEAVLKEEAR